LTAASGEVGLMEPAGETAAFAGKAIAGRSGFPGAAGGAAETAAGCLSL